MLKTTARFQWIVYPCEKHDLFKILEPTKPEGVRVTKLCVSVEIALKGLLVEEFEISRRSYRSMLDIMTPIRII